MQIHIKDTESIFGNIVTNYIQLYNGVLIFNINVIDNLTDKKEYEVIYNLFNSKLFLYQGELFIFNNSVIVLYKENSELGINDIILNLQNIFSSQPILKKDISYKTYQFTKSIGNFLEFYKQNFLNSTVNLEIQYEENSIKSLYSPMEKILYKVVDDCIIENIISINTEKENRPVIKQITIDKNKLIDILDKAYRDNFNSFEQFYSFCSNIIDTKLLIKLLKYTEKESFGYLIPLSIYTLKSKEFELFDNAISHEFKANIIISFRVHEIINNLEVFFDEKKQLKDKGYKLCLEAINLKLINILNVSNLGLDLLQLCLAEVLPEDLEALKIEVDKLKPAHLILNGYDKNTYRIGSYLGIYLYREL